MVSPRALALPFLDLANKLSEKGQSDLPKYHGLLTSTFGIDPGRSAICDRGFLKRALISGKASSSALLVSIFEGLVPLWYAFFWHLTCYPNLNVRRFEVLARKICHLHLHFAQARVLYRHKSCSFNVALVDVSRTFTTFTGTFASTCLVTRTTMDVNMRFLAWKVCHLYLYLPA